MAGLALHPDRTAHQLGQAAHDRQAQAGAAVLAGHRTVGLAEGLEQMGQPVGRNADARVRDRELQQGLAALCVMFAGFDDD